MSEKAIQTLLKGLRAALGRVALYPPSHPEYAGAIEDGWRMTTGVTSGADECVIAIRDDVCYLDGTLLAHTSLMFASLLDVIKRRDIESITFAGPADKGDYEALVRYLAGLADDVPAGGSIRLNEIKVDDLDTSISALQTSYIGAVGSLRRANQRLAGTGSIELAPIMSAVDMLIDQSLSAASGALLLSTVSSHDEYTFYHSVNTCLMSVALGQLIGLSREELIAIGAGAALHDVGKVAISRNTLNHPGRLDKDQWQEVALHPQEGAQAILIAGGPGHEIAAAIALEHHARYDGLGYPHMPSRPRPHLFSRLVSAVDVYDALTTRRPYRRSQTPNRALQLLLQGAGSAFDPQMVKLFIEMMGIFPPGSILRLFDGRTVVVTRQGEVMSLVEAILVRDSKGAEIAHPEPMMVSVDDIADQLTPEAADLEPSELLNHGELKSHFAPSLPPSRMDVPVGLDDAAMRAEATRSLSDLSELGDTAA